MGFHRGPCSDLCCSILTSYSFLRLEYHNLSYHIYGADTQLVTTWLYTTTLLQLATLWSLWSVSPQSLHDTASYANTLLGSTAQNYNQVRLSPGPLSPFLCLWSVSPCRKNEVGNLAVFILNLSLGFPPPAPLLCWVGLRKRVGSGRVLCVVNLRGRLRGLALQLFTCSHFFCCAVRIAVIIRFPTLKFAPIELVSWCDPLINQSLFI